MTEIPASRLQHFPVAWFSVVMGLGGLTIAWHRAEETLQLPFHVSPYLLAISTLVFIALAGLYSAKALKFRDSLIKEWNHPIRMNFVPTFSIGLILLSIAWLPINPAYSQLLWIAGTAAHLMLTFYVITQWVHHTKFEIAHLNPAWFIPVVGNILVPIAGVHHAPADLSWFFFSLGLFFWPVLTAILFYRLIFHASLAERFMPTLFIFIAPPAVGFISWYSLVGEIDAFGRVLYFVGLFFALLLLVQASYFTRLKFFLSWWAYSFPLAAITVATFVMYELSGNLLFARLASILLGVATVVIAGLILRTALAVARKEICLQD